MSPLEHLSEYPFKKLDDLISKNPSTREDIIFMHLGEPQGMMSDAYSAQTLSESSFNKYPPVAGIPEWSDAFYKWFSNRFQVSNDTLKETQAIPGSGSKELINTATHFVTIKQRARNKNTFIMPNPMYQPYKGSAILNGAAVNIINTNKESNYLPNLSDISVQDLKSTAGFFLCNPTNPQGAVASLEYLKQLLELAKKYDFFIIADECYSEIYHTQEAPYGLINAVESLNYNLDKVIIINTLSKMSNAAGLRSGALITSITNAAEIIKIRSFIGATPSIFVQKLSAKLWTDLEDIAKIRKSYQEKYVEAKGILSQYPFFRESAASFFIWLYVKNGEEFAKKVYQEHGVVVMPGAYYSDTINNLNPGKDYIRIALTDNINNVSEGCKRIIECLKDF